MHSRKRKREVKLTNKVQRAGYKKCQGEVNKQQYKLQNPKYEIGDFAIQGFYIEIQRWAV